MIKETIGNLLEHVTTGIIVQQVNAQGVMGSGIAKSIREKWPVVFDEYSEHLDLLDQIYPTHSKGDLFLGKMIPVQVGPDLWVCNIIGQQFYGKSSLVRFTSYDALDNGFRRLAKFAPLFWDNESACEIHFPTIGCGLGGGDWGIVSAIVNKHLPDHSKTLWRLPA